MSFWWFRPNLGANPLYQDHWTALYRLQYALTLPIAGLGVGWSLRRGLARPAWILYAVLVYTTLIHLVFHVLTRFRWEIELLLLIFVALALEAGWRSMQGRWEKR